MFSINNSMEIEDGRNLLFCDPNAYIQQYKIETPKVVKKIVFQEPYEMVPDFYLNNNFTKHNCCYPGNNKSSENKNDCNCNHEKNNKFSSCGNSDNQNCDQKHIKNDSGFNFKKIGFDFKSLLPLLGMFNNGGSSNLTSLMGLLNGKQGDQNGQTNLISSILNNNDMMSGILNIFNGGVFNLFKKSQTTNKQLKTTDFEIKNYTRVE